MADNAEPFWPSLYSRLVPEKYYGESFEEQAARSAGDDWGPAHFLTDVKTLKKHIEIDLLALLNATCIESILLAEEIDSQDVMIDRSDYPLEAYPFVKRSVVNYGLPSVVGRQVYNLPVGALEEDLRSAIIAYEPRLDPSTLRVRVELNENDEIDPEKPIGFSVEATIRSSSDPLKVYINSIWDLEKIRSDVKMTR